MWIQGAPYGFKGLCLARNLAFSHYPYCIKWYQSDVFLGLVAANGEGVEGSNGESRGKYALGGNRETKAADERGSRTAC